MCKRLNSIPPIVLVIVLGICSQLQAQVLYETDFMGDSAMTDWITTDDFWTHDPAAGTLTVAGASAASAAHYGKIELTDFTVSADVEVNNSAAAVVARFASLSDPFYMSRYHPQNAILQLYVINPTTLLASLPLAEMPGFGPAQTYAVSITVEGNSITGSLIQGDLTYSVQALDDTATSGFGGIRVWGPGENVLSGFAISGLSKAFAETPHPIEAGTEGLAQGVGAGGVLIAELSSRRHPDDCQQGVVLPARGKNLQGSLEGLRPASSTKQIVS